MTGCAGCTRPGSSPTELYKGALVRATRVRPVRRRILCSGEPLRCRSIMQARHKRVRIRGKVIQQNVYSRAHRSPSPRVSLQTHKEKAAGETASQKAPEHRNDHAPS
jgi:hypothetical protein